MEKAEELKVAALNQLTGQFVQAGLTGESLTRAVELAAPGVVVHLDQSGQLVTSFRSFTNHKDSQEYAAAVLQQHGAAIGPSGRSFSQMLRS